MMTMVFTHFGGKDVGSTEEEVRAILNKEVNGTNAFHICQASQRFYPYLNVFINGDYAYVYYMPCDTSFGLLAYREDVGLDPDGITVFHINTPEEEMEVYNDYVIRKETAVEVVLDLMRRTKWPASSEDLPACVQWDEQ